VGRVNPPPQLHVLMKWNFTFSQLKTNFDRAYSPKICLENAMPCFTSIPESRFGPKENCNGFCMQLIGLASLGLGEMCWQHEHKVIRSSESCQG